MSVEVIEMRRRTDLLTRGAFSFDEVVGPMSRGGKTAQSGTFSGLPGRMSPLQDHMRGIVSGHVAEIAHDMKLCAVMSSGTFDEDILEPLGAQVVGNWASLLVSGDRLLASRCEGLVRDIGRVTKAVFEQQNLPRMMPSHSIETVDWELQMENVPSRPVRTVVVKFEKGSYRLPRIVDNPEE